MEKILAGLLACALMASTAHAQDDLTVEDVAGILETIDYGTRVCDFDIRWGLMTAHTLDWGSHFGINGVEMKDHMRAANAEVRSLAAADLDGFCQLAKGLAIQLDMI